MNPFARKPVASVPVEITDPGTGEKTGIVIRITGRESEAVKKVERAQADRRFERANLTGNFAPLKAEELERDQAERLVAATAGWDGVEDESGQPLHFSPENAKRLYTEVSWVREQVQRAMDDRTRFFGPSASSSSPSPSTSSGSPG